MLELFDRSLTDPSEQEPEEIGNEHTAVSRVFESDLHECDGCDGCGKPSEAVPRFPFRIATVSYPWFVAPLSLDMVDPRSGALRPNIISSYRMNDGACNSWFPPVRSALSVARVSEFSFQDASPD